MARGNGIATQDTPNVTEMIERLISGRGIGPDTGTTIGPDADIKYHDQPDVRIPRGMTMEFLERMAHAKAEELNKVHAFQHVTKYRPDDGAHAASIVIKRRFGMTVGRDKKLPFGMTQPPGYRTIAISHNRTMEVPWGLLEVPALPGAKFEFTATENADGPVFAVVVESPKKHAAAIEGFFRDLDDELRLNSIYRGKALMGANELKFKDFSTFNPTQIVYADRVQEQIAAHIFTVLRHTAATRRANLSTKRAVLAYGPYGTGKTSLGAIVAQEANEFGWTFLSATAGKDRLEPVFRTAALYEPCVILIEDLNRYTPKTSEKDALSAMLDLFDGIGTKDSKLLIVMTTNDIDAIPAGMLRPGRLDAVIEIAGLDRNGSESLIRAVVPPGLLDPRVDFDAVYAEMDGFQPAWVRAVATNATANALHRTGGELQFQLTTEDLVKGATDLHRQLGLMRKASEGTPVNKLDETLGEIFVENARKAIDNVPVVDLDGDLYARLKAS